MTTDFKTRFTLRIPESTSEEVDRRAKALGLTKNGYINLILHKELKNKAG